MARDDSRIAAILGELSDLSRRIAERAAELGRLAGERGSGAPPADVAATAAALVAAIEAPSARVDAGIDQLEGKSARPRRGTTRRGEATPPTKRPRTPTAVKSRRLARSRPDLQPTRSRDARPRSRQLLPALVSTATHLVVLLGLALIFVAGNAKPERVVITLGAQEEHVLEEFPPVEFEASEEAEEAALEEALEPLPAVDALASEPLTMDEMAASASPLAVDVSPVVPVSFDAGDMLATVGGNGRGETSGAGRGGGGSAGSGPAGAAAFFGRSGQGKSVCFICDNSNSYRDGGFHMVLDEVARAVDSLQPGQSFFVIFFSDAAYPMFQPERLAALEPASPEAKRRLRHWLGTVEMCQGGQGIEEAITIAGSLGADVVYFLSDGDHAASVVDRAGAADFGGAVVHTFGMQQSVHDKRTGLIDPERVHTQQGLDQNLIAIAAAHGGTFTPVVVPPQAAALERMRPIRKNRSRGPVWGLKL